MKKFKFLTLGVLLAFMLTATVGVMPVSAQTPIGYLFSKNINLFVYENIVDGAENVTVNEDGSWTASGPFTLKTDILYDYELTDYGLNISHEGDIAFDLITTWYTSETQSYQVKLSDEVYGWPFGSDDLNWIDLSLKGAYQWHTQNEKDWESDGTTTIRIPTITYTPYEEGTTVFSGITLYIPIELKSVTVFGDVDYDSNINMIDVATMYGVVGNGKPTETATAVMDMDDDGALTMRDVMMLYQYVSGKS